VGGGGGGGGDYYKLNCLRTVVCIYMTLLLL
jgi:hypothetical protein